MSEVAVRQESAPIPYSDDPTGGRLVVVPFWVSRTPEAFLGLVAREGVTVLNQTPSAFRQFIAAEAQQGAPVKTALRYVIFGGEALGMRTILGTLCILISVIVITTAQAKN